MDHANNRLENTPAPPAGTSADQRGAKRLTLLLRTAKLACEAGEFVCIVHDVSETGVRLRTFHPLPEDRHMALVQGNGAMHFVERVWQKDGYAGFRFDAPIDLSEFPLEPSPWPRRQVRINLERPGLIMAQGGVNTAAVVNLSQQGACIATDRYLAIGQRVRLEASGMPSRMGCVRWRKLPHYGLVFDQSMTLHDFACMVAELQIMAEATPLRDQPEWGSAVLAFRR